MGSVDQTKGGHTVAEITMQHTQLEHHLLERVDAMSAKMADFVRSYTYITSRSSRRVSKLL